MSDMSPHPRPARVRWGLEQVMQLSGDSPASFCYPSLSAASCSTSNIQPVARALRTELNWVLGSSLPTASRGQGQARQPLPWLLPEPSHLTEPPSPHPVLSLCTRALMFLLPV